MERSFALPSARIAGLAGVLAGIGLIIEGALWGSSGWTADTFADPSGALRFLDESGGNIRAAVLAGLLNLVFATIFLGGLTSWLRPTSPTLATASLYLGLIGVAAHGLVPAGLWLGVPSFSELAASDPAAAQGAWGGFAAFIAGAGGLGSLFLGLSLLAAGLAIRASRRMNAAIGWIGILAGSASALTMLTADTTLSGLAAAAYLPSLLLVMAFRIWAGHSLSRAEPPQITNAQPSPSAR